MGSAGHAPDRSAHPRNVASALEVLDGLLSILTDVLDIREVIDRVSQLVQRVLPHDVLGVMEISENGDRIRLLAVAGIAGGAQNFEAPIGGPDFLTTPWKAMVIDDVSNNSFFSGGPAAKAGMQSVLTVPISFGGRLRAAVNFFSREKTHFSEADFPIAQRIASHITFAMSHHRLAEEARQRQALEAHASKLDLLDQSLASLTDTGELKELIDRISNVTRQVLPHDGLAVAVLMPDGRHIRRYAASGWYAARVPEIIEISPEYPEAMGDFELVDDVTKRSEPLNVVAAKNGFLSVLRVRIRLGGKFAAGVAFLSRTRSSYQLRDVPAARRIANRLALKLEREHVVEATKRADKADARAAQLESRVRQLTDELDARTGYRRVIGESVPWREVLKKAAQVAAVETTVLLLG